MDEYRVLVTGSRTWTDIAWFHREMWGRLSLDGLVIVHGAARKGIDKMADDWARRQDIPVERYPADWKNGGRKAGFVRNTLMVMTRPDLCMAFIKDDSAGASHCAATALHFGIPTLVFHDRRSDEDHLPT